MRHSPQAAQTDSLCYSSLHSPRSDDAKLFADCGDNVGGAFKVGALVSCSDNGAQAGFAFGNRWVAERTGEHTFRK